MNFPKLDNEEEVAGFPGFTEWEYREKCCLRLAYIPNIRKYFLGHWIVNPFAPVTLILVYTLSLLMACIYVVPVIEKAHILLWCLLILLYSLTMISFIRIITDGPGYMPFYWSKIKSDWDVDRYSGVISNSEQAEWVEKQQKPPRSSICPEAGRFVLRPDRYFILAASWIGKRNHKYFVLFSFYSSIYSLIFVVISAVGVSIQYKDELSPAVFVLSLTAIALCALFLVSVSFFIETIIGISKNVTNLEAEENTVSSVYNKGLKSNFEDVFGLSSNLFSWILPIRPWNHISTTDLSWKYGNQEQIYIN